MNKRTILRTHRGGARALISALTLASLSASVGSLMPAHAAVIPPDGEIARCIARAAGRKDWLEKTLIGLRDQEGGWKGAEIPNVNGSHDLGPLQINSWWVPKLAALLHQPEQHVRDWLKNDICFNVDAAAGFFSPPSARPAITGRRLGPITVRLQGGNGAMR